MNSSEQPFVLFVAVAVLAVLFSTCLGAFAGGAVGYWAARSAARQMTDKYLQEWMPAPALPEFTWPTIPGPERPHSAPETRGALVTEVVENSPAQRAGIRAGDLIVAVDEVGIDAQHPLDTLIREHVPGDRVQIALMRDGTRRTVGVRLAEHPEDNRAAYLGLFFQMQPGPLESPDVD